MGDVFINYRREDSAPYVGRICDRLESAFGSEHVFMDVEDIAPGADFAEAIDKTVGSCDVLLAIIGPRWVELLKGPRGDLDFVVYEIAVALNRGVTVIPVLVGGAKMPLQSELPPELAALTRRQAISMRDSGFDQDANDLVRSVQRATGGGRSGKRLAYSVIAAGVVIAIVGSALLLLRSRQQASLNGTWIARMERAGQKPYNIRLRFQQSGRVLTGQVEYPTGAAVIEDGTVDGRALLFITRHVPQFESAPAQIRFTGEIRGREVDLTSVDPNGLIANGIARKSD
jgi:hypothetical protein